MSCCVALAYHLTNRCHHHKDPFDCPDAVITRTKDGGLGLPIKDGGQSYIEILWCPWCGKKQ